jgi:hypothetical protein
MRAKARVGGNLNGTFFAQRKIHSLHRFLISVQVSELYVLMNDLQSVAILKTLAVSVPTQECAQYRSEPRHQTFISFYQLGSQISVSVA